MSKSESRTEGKRNAGHHHVEAGRALVAIGVLVALWCAAFAAISVWFELTNYFAAGRYADDDTAISVVNWFVAVLKLAGVVLALLAVHPRLVAPRTVGTLLWAAFATVTVYVAGSITQAFVMLAGIAGNADEVDAWSVTYVLAFMLAAAGFGVLATSHSRRAGLGTRIKVIGACGAPLVLGSVFVILPAILRAVGMLSASS
ncbi:MAG TPA: hypothetical protein VIP77_08645 [Jiangellaceae bacterium]